MSGKKKFICFGSILIITIILIIIMSFIKPVINLELNGDKIINLTVGDEYIEFGAEGQIQNLIKNKNLKINISGKVDSSKIGKYIITYSAKYKNVTRKIYRVVNVIDNIKPEIKVNSIKACKNNKTVNVDAKVIDNYDGDITDNLEYKIENDKIYLIAVDSSNNKVEYSEDVNYIDNEPPELTLKGDKKILIPLNGDYVEYGITATDSCDGDLTSSINVKSNVNTKKAGTYNVTYEVKDNLGNASKITRTVVVLSNETNKTTENGIIYLTFDDGPGVYTEKILDVLDKYNVKATFFVTNQFPKYINLIKKEYDQGHSIGIHTYSHKWLIYENVDTYMNDFKKMDEVVYNTIGIHTKLFRFPGGSSNTVSRNYCKGIMTELAQKMTEEGYIYFDWTFDSGDTVKNKNTKEGIINTVKTNLKGDGEYIILMHDIKKNTLDALPNIIEYALANGYVFQALNENSKTVHFKIAN